MFAQAKHEFSTAAALRRSSCGAAALGLVAFWGGLLIAVWRYPAEYDWRYMTLTSLLSAAHDPAGHLWASGGIALCGVCGFCWMQLLAWRWWDEGARGRLSDARLLQAGALLMAAAVVLPQGLLGIRKAHEILVVFAFSCWCIGMVRLLFRAIEQALQRRMQGSIRRKRRYAALIGGIAALPVLLAGAAQAYVYYALPALHWVSLSWRSQGVPVYLSFAFWEWITCAVLSACVAAVTLATLATEPTAKGSSAAVPAAGSGLDPRRG
jgi:hypothetical protein